MAAAAIITDVTATPDSRRALESVCYVVLGLGANGTPSSGRLLNARVSAR
jgi:hypothetical protein